MSTDPTIRVFDNFYNFDVAVGADQYEVVLSYFKSVCSTDQVAQSFTNLLFRVASITQVEVVELLQSIQGKTAMEIQITLAYYLNTISETKSVLYGVSNLITPNEKVQRNVIQ